MKIIGQMSLMQGQSLYEKLHKLEYISKLLLHYPIISNITTHVILGVDRAQSSLY